MNKDVIISVTGNRNSGEDGKMEFVTEGKYYKEDNAYCVTYDESEVTGLKGTTTTLRVSDGKVTLVRTGTVNSHFVFEKGHKHVSYYDTSNGAYTVGVIASDVSIDIDDSGGSILVDYSIDIDNNNSGRSDFFMWIREAKRDSSEYNSNN